MQVNGLILAGGASLRMGADKSLIEFYGLPQRQHLFNLLSPLCKSVFTSCKNADTVPAHLYPLPDKFDIRGPFNGILSAFDYDPEVAWLTVPVDMPFIDERAIQRLLENRKPGTVATCYFDSDGELPEPLFTVWEADAAPLLKKFYDAGKTRPREFLMNHEVNIIKPLTPLVHVNVNSPEDLENFKRRYSS